jgi:phenylalanyl-tRNA synthetase beta chain
MKFTLSWLKEHLDTDADLETICDRLVRIGLEVEGVEDRAKGLDGFVVAHVVEAVQHPNADRLRVCTVDTGSQTVQVVCGAPNARTGMKGVFAASGMHVPGTGIDLKKSEIRGVESNGMLLSEREMGLSDAHDGIVDLDPAAPIGAPAAEIMGLTDPVIEIGITPNRGDCLGVRGVARDLAATGLGVLKPLDTTPVPGAFDSPIGVTLDFPADAASACPYFVGRLVRGVTNGSSPKWMQDRLRAVGLRPISALVDITNYVMLDLNRPLHVFDAAKVHGGLTVRLSKPGETFLALNEKDYTLDDTMTVIVDENGPEALGGVMGGEQSGCTPETVDVFVEAAYFDPVRTAATGRKLNLLSDARYRFERGIDPTFLEPGMEIATRLILDLCGGEPSTLVVAGADPSIVRAVELRTDRVATLGGLDVPADESARILSDLGFDVSEKDGALSAGVPPWRDDIVGEACLVEEVLRITGLDAVPPVSVALDGAMPPDPLNTAQRRRVAVRRTLAQRGLVEAVTFSFLSEADASHFAATPDSMRLSNPISADLDVMRPGILPNLLRAAGRNDDRGVPNAALFEVGPVYAGDAPGDQQTVAGGLRLGRMNEKGWAQGARGVDVFDAKADALAALAAAGFDPAAPQAAAEAPAYFHPGRSGVLRLGPKKVLAYFGELHPRVLKAFGVEGPVAAFEVFLDAIPEPKGKRAAARAPLTVSPFQPVTRDFAFVVDAAVEAARLLGAARTADKTLISDVRLFDVFEGESVGVGKKSIAVSVVLQPVDATLTDDDIDAVGSKIVSAVEKATGGVLRG